MNINRSSLFWGILLIAGGGLYVDFRRAPFTEVLHRS